VKRPRIESFWLKQESRKTGAGHGGVGHGTAELSTAPSCLVENGTVELGTARPSSACSVLLCFAHFDSQVGSWVGFLGFGPLPCIVRACWGLNPPTKAIKSNQNETSIPKRGFELIKQFRHVNAHKWTINEGLNV
jgi:hypothetical protein